MNKLLSSLGYFENPIWQYRIHHQIITKKTQLSNTNNKLPKFETIGINLNHAETIDEEIQQKFKKTVQFINNR